ncbi:MAG: DUF4040 domain-containing protein [bacterium]|nr:DUF4040 domain-containing protein [bacterium]
MIWQLDLIVLIIVMITAFAALNLKDLVAVAILFGVYSFMMCLLWAGMGAVDVAFTEATVGAGISTIFFLGTALHVRRRSKD